MKSSVKISPASAKRNAYPIFADLKRTRVFSLIDVF